jgi:hypothetical protein
MLTKFKNFFVALDGVHFFAYLQLLAQEQLLLPLKVAARKQEC